MEVIAAISTALVLTVFVVTVISVIVVRYDDHIDGFLRRWLDWVERNFGKSE